MTRMVVLSILTILIIGFQNCSKMQLQELPANLANKSTFENSPSNYIPNTADKLFVPNNSSSSHSPENFDVYYYQVDLATGGIAAYDFNDGLLTDRTYCLNDTDLSELKSILSTAAVCDKAEERAEDKASDKLCTAVYTEPYASLIFGEDEVKLGEATSGCDTPVDLCGDHKDLLKGFITNLLNEIESKACIFETL